MHNTVMPILTIALLVTLLGACSQERAATDRPPPASWLAGDHHIHSRYSVGWDREQDPPAPIIGGDAIYPIPMNNLMGRRFGLSWMVATDHGGPNHSRVSLDAAYPELLQSRAAMPDVIQFFGLELNAPGADHASVIIPYGEGEARILSDLERRFDRHEAYPPDANRNEEAVMLEALGAMAELARPPVVIANHPSRSASGYGEYGLYEPRELRNWHDTAPNVAVGMAGAPGHQAIALTTAERFADPATRYRGAYGRYPTAGGFDQMTAKVGGFWDSMLGEGRRWWITANSDSHVHYSEGGIDFWPGEYSKTYVHATANPDAILAALRGGRVFVTTGDLISALDFTVSVNGESAMIGGELQAAPGDEVIVDIRLQDPDGLNHGGRNPSVARVDLIHGAITGTVRDPTTNSHPGASVMRRFTADDWSRDGEYLVMQHRFIARGAGYLRVRGTNTDQLEPEPDPPGEDPWQDLWFYSNPVFIRP